MIRVILTYADHVVDIRTDADGNPEILETYIRHASEQMHDQITFAHAVEATR